MWIRSHIRTQLLDILGVHSFHVETVALLSKIDADKHLNVEFELDELNLTSVEVKASYAQIME